MTAPGWLPPGAPQSEYRPIPAMSASGLKRFRRSPLHYRHEIDHPKPPTPAMELGRATHVAILEPERYAGQWTVLGQCDGRKKDGARCGYAARYGRDGKGFCKRHLGLPPTDRAIKQEDHDRILAMQEAVMAHPMANALITGHPELAEIERSAVFRDTRTDALCKFRPDRIVRVGEGYLVDLKTARDASPGGFRRAITNFGYHLQAAFYLRGMAELGEPMDSFVFVAVESDPPHGVGCYEVSQEDLLMADLDVTTLLLRYRECIERDEWPGYGPDVEQITLPPWAFSQENR